MNPVRKLETQCSHAQFLSHLPAACGNRPYEIIDNQIIVHDGDQQVRITVSDMPIRHLGSLDLPMEEIRFEFEGYDEASADDFMTDYRHHTFRAGGG